MSTVIAPNGGELLADALDRRVEVLCEHPSINATWSRFGPGRDGADLHVHYEHSDHFFVLEGELTVKVGVDGEERTVAAGELARVPPGVVHGFRNGAGAELRYVNLHVPGMQFVEYMRGLRDGRPFSYDQFDPPPDGGRPLAEVTIGPPQLDRAELQIDVIESVPEVERELLTALYVLEGPDAGTWAQIEPGEQSPLAAARALRIRTPVTGGGA